MSSCHTARKVSVGLHEGVNYVIQGSAEGYEGQYVNVMDYGKLDKSINSTVVKDGKFQLTGNYERNALVRIEVGDKDNYADGVLDEIVVPNFSSHLPEPITKLNKELVDFEKKITEKKGKNNSIEYLTKVINKSNNGVKEKILLLELPRHLDLSSGQWEKVYSSTDTLIQNLPLAQEMNEKYEKIKEVEPGNMFIDFPVKTIDGTVKNFSDYIGTGEKVLVIFWTEWCPGARTLIEEVLTPAYNKLKGIKIIGVNLSFFDLAKKYIEAKDIKWENLFQDKVNPMSLYHFSWIPMIYVFGSDGIILERFSSYETLNDLIKKYQ